MNNFNIWLSACLAALLFWAHPAHAQPPTRPNANADRLLVLSYHDIAAADAPYTDPYTIDVRTLVRQLDWLRTQGYRFVSLQDVVDDRAGTRPLPPKAVLLTFDDGFQGVYTQAYPVLRLFRAPALIALVGEWQEQGRGPEGTALLNWDQIREMVGSGLVEVANHSYASHGGIPANPQGNTQPALTTLHWSAAGYETPDQFEARVRSDLRRNNDTLRRHLGQAPRAMVWPFGSHTPAVVEIARQEGLTVGLTLDDGLNTPDTPLSTLRRVLVDHQSGLGGMAHRLRAFENNEALGPRSTRIMHVDLDYIHDPDPVQQERNLGRLLERVQAMGATHVYLQAFADPDGDGVADALYFPNRHLPLRSDLFNRAAWQLRTRAGVQVYAWMPVLAFSPPAGSPPQEHVVLAATGPDATPRPQGYHRLSPYSPQARAWIGELYEDLARSARFQGLLFHDDATLSDWEDDSPHGRAARAAAGLPASLNALHRDPQAMARWTQDKIRLLDDFTLELAAVVRRHQPQLRTARNLYARVLMEPAAGAWLAQSFETALRHYDEVAIMAMPHMEKAGQPLPWLRELFARVARHPGALERTVFELQTREWNTGRPISATELQAKVRLLHQLGARHIAYYPDDLFHDQPPLQQMRPVFSARTAPAP